MTCDEQIAIAFLAGAVAVPTVLLWGLIVPWWVPGSWWARPPKRLP